jgi:hypothetical protein
MSIRDTSYRFPYEHLAVIGVDRLKKYVPPAGGGGSTPPRTADSDAPDDTGSSPGVR